MVMDACVCSVDGAQCIRQRATGLAKEAAALGERMANLLFEAGAQAILEEVGRARG